jgi:glutathione S-transferase
MRTKLLEVAVVNNVAYVSLGCAAVFLFERTVLYVISRAYPTHIYYTINEFSVSFFQYMSVLEKLLEANKTGWFVGDKVTVADLRSHQLVGWLKGGSLDGIPPTCVDAYPMLVANWDKIEALPKVVAWRAKYGKPYETFEFIPEELHYIWA